MSYSEGMEDAIREAENFADDDAAAAYWLHGSKKAQTEDLSFRGATGQTQMARLYRGKGGGHLMYIHGGGWVSGSIALNDRACHRLALQSGWDVTSVSYRLAPAHPYPAGLEDCRTALRWMRDAFGKAPLVLAGASAGANLALALALDEPVDGLVLFYGAFSDDTSTESHRTYGTGYGFTTARLLECLGHYDPKRTRATDPRICPLKASDTQLSSLPPSCLISAELDVLRDDTRALAARLNGLGIPHLFHEEPGVTHGFINRGRLVPAADACLDRAAAFLTELDPQ